MAPLGTHTGVEQPVLDTERHEHATHHGDDDPPPDGGAPRPVRAALAEGGADAAGRPAHRLPPRAA